MSNETMVTLQGWVGGDVVLRPAAGTVVAAFRVGCTPRRFQRSSGEWVDGPTQWYAVNAWRGLGQHCHDSIRRGDPVVVHGRLQQRSYVSKAGVEVTTLEVEATVVGHDLTWGIAEFTRRAVLPAAPTGPATPAAPLGGESREPRDEAATSAA